MLNVLINAYAVSPNWGSEPGMGWNWITNLAKYCNVFVITEGEWKEEIHQALNKLPQKDNIHFYFNPVSDSVRKMCWNQGDWRFYWYYRKWQIGAYEIAKQIIAENKIDILHQLNMICYREPSFLWKIKDIPFVWGPIGGYSMFPIAYLKDAPLIFKLKICIKNAINFISFRYSCRVRMAMKRADSLVAAYPETHNAIKTIYNPSAVMISETGATVNHNAIPHKSDNSEFKILWVGKYDHRKQLGIAIKAMNLIKEKKNIHLFVLGTGYKSDVEKYSAMVSDLGLSESVHLLGKVPHHKSKEYMNQSDVFLFTSVSDATSTVVTEAISAGLPVVCHNTRGFGAIINNDIGRKVNVVDPENSAREFARIILELEGDRSEVKRLSYNCIEMQENISWDSNARKMLNEYERAIEYYHNSRR